MAGFGVGGRKKTKSLEETRRLPSLPRLSILSYSNSPSLGFLLPLTKSHIRGEERSDKDVAKLPSLLLDVAGLDARAGLKEEKQPRMRQLD